MWLYENKMISSIEDMGEKVPFGFICKITHVPTGKQYIGKKQLFHTSKKVLGKKELAAAPKIQGRPQKFKQVIKESDWKTYYGSEETIKKMIKEGKKDEFIREILCFVKNKKTLSYFETKYQFIHEVLEYPNKWFNTNINGHYFSSDFIG